MPSTIGRPRSLTDEQVRAVLEWNRTRRTLVQVAREYHVSVSTIRSIIRRKGQYKRASPFTDKG